jgi:RNA polymerase sigma factor (sigma-70 family)
MVQGVAELVRRAGEGEQRAWDALVERFNGLVWSVARGYGLGDTDAADVVQTTWLRLVEHLSRIREPDHVGAWLATTARREAQRTKRRAARQLPAEEDDLDTGDPSPGPEVLAVAADRDRVLWRSLLALPERCRTLLRILAADPPPSYQEVSAALSMPVGSIGPTRGRCLELLRQALRTVGLVGDGLGT